MPGIDSATGVQFSSSEDFYDHILNDMFLPSVADTVINPNTISRYVERDKTRVQGKNVVFPIHTGRNLGGNAVGPGGYLPDPGAQKYDGYSFPTRHLYQRILFDGITMDASSSDIASWLRVVESEVKGAAKDMARRRNRIFNGDGSGRLCQLAAAVSSSTTVSAVDLDGMAVDSDTIASTDFAPTKHLNVGQRVAFVTSGGTVEDDGVIATIASATSFTVASAVTASDNSYVVEISREGSTATADSGFQNEPMGLAGIFSDGNPSDGVTGFQGVDATAAGNEWHQANVLDNSGVARDLTEPLLQSALSTAIEVGEANVGALYSGFGMADTYSNLLLSDKRFVNTTELKGGSTAISFSNIPWIVDRDCYTNRVLFMDFDNIRLYVLSDPKWMSYDGNRFSRLADKDGYQATLLCRETLGADVRDKCTILTDLNQD